ncbi:hypothetical protein Tco_0420711 [Tanacetum coccineum]
MFPKKSNVVSVSSSNDSRGSCLRARLLSQVLVFVFVVSRVGASKTLVVCIVSSTGADWLADCLLVLEPVGVVFPAVVVVVSLGALVEAGSFPDLLLLDPRFCNISIGSATSTASFMLFASILIYDARNGSDAQILILFVLSSKKLSSNAFSL